MKKSVAWEIPAGESPKKLDLGSVDLEKHLEAWISADITIVADDVLLLGRQVYTIYNTAIDLLGIDASGDLVVLELKRDQTLRDTVAQGLEYAEWCSRQGDDFILDLGAKRYGGEQAFRDRFAEKFQAPFPETLNQRQRILIVAPEITERTDRLLAYLASNFGVPINGVSFDVFQLEGRQLLVRHVAVDENIIEGPPKPPGVAKHRTLEEFRQAAADNGIAAIFDHLLSMKDILPTSERFWQSFAMKTKNAAGKVFAGFTIYPTADTNPGTCDVVLYPTSVLPLYGVSDEMFSAFLGSLGTFGAESKSWGGGTRVALASVEHAHEFDRRYREFVTNAKMTAPALNGELAQ